MPTEIVPAIFRDKWASADFCDLIFGVIVTRETRRVEFEVFNHSLRQNIAQKQLSLSICVVEGVSTSSTVKAGSHVSFCPRHPAKYLAFHVSGVTRRSTTRDSSWDSMGRTSSSDAATIKSHRQKLRCQEHTSLRSRRTSGRSSA